MATVASYLIKFGVINESALDKLTNKVGKSTSAFTKLQRAATAAFSVYKAVSYVNAGTEAYKQQAVAVNQLGQVMHNTMGATQAQIDELVKYTNAQERLGIVSAATQQAGAKELGTYLTKTESLQKLIPVLNDMLAHQYGLNASQQQAVGIAQMVGKVLDGQVGALNRAGYRFDEAQENVLKFGNEQQRVALLSQIVTQYVGGMNEALASTPEGRLAQLNNRLGTTQERIGKIWLTIKSAFVPAITQMNSLIDRFADWFELNQQRVIEAVQTAAAVVMAAVNTVVTVVGKLVNAIRWVRDNLDWVVVGVTAFAVAIKGVSVAVGIWTAALKILNIVLMANPVGLIIAGIAALAAAITYVVYKTDGWGKQWESVVNFMKYTFMAFTSSVKFYYDTLINGIMLGLDYIKLGWYNFKEALGIGDSSENQSAIARINAEVEARQNAILGGAKQIAEYAQKAKDSLTWELSWNSERGFGDILKGIRKKMGLDGLDGLPTTPNRSGGLGLTTSGTAEAIATGGTRSTNVTINIGNMVETMNFNRPDMNENYTEAEASVLDALLRVVNMANSRAR